MGIELTLQKGVREEKRAPERMWRKSVLYPGNNNTKEGNKNNTEASEIEDPGECGGKEVKRVVLRERGLCLRGVEFC